MSKVYKNNTLTLYLDTTIDLTNASAVNIKYKTPSGKTGTKVATIHTDNQSILYDFPSGVLNESGLWTFWAHVVFAGLNYSYGDAVLLKIYEEGVQV